MLAGGPPKLLYYGIADDAAWDVGLTCGGEIWVWLEALRGLAGAGRARRARHRDRGRPRRARHLLVTPRRRVAGDLDGELVDAVVAAGQEAIDRERNADGRGDRRADLRRGARAAAARSSSSAPSTPPSRSAAWRTRSAGAPSSSIRAARSRPPSACPRPIGSSCAGPRPGYDELERRARGRTSSCSRTTPSSTIPRSPRRVSARRRLRRRARLAAHAGEALRAACARAGSPRTSSRASRGPVGLDIGAHTPEETAVSILAEVIASRSGRDGGRLISGTGGIHVIDESLEARVPSPEC